jgi:heme oxygenase
MPTSSNSPGQDALFLLQLREQTAPAHRLLEETQLSKSLMSPTVSISDYKAYLQRMRSVIAWYDTKVLPLLSGILDVETRKKLAAIDADLTALDGSIESGFLLDKPEDTAMAMGYAYVMEGSTLGGKMILQHVRQVLPVTEENGAAYFAGYGADTGRQWKEFLAAFTGYTITHNVEEKVTAAAVALFSALHSHFEAVAA